MPTTIREVRLSTKLCLHIMLGGVFGKSSISREDYQELEDLQSRLIAQIRKDLRIREASESIFNFPDSTVISPNAHAILQTFATRLSSLCPCE